MTSLFLHFLSAIIVLSLISALYSLEIPLSDRTLLASCTILPDAIDKTLTGTRYPFHSLLISSVVLILLNSVVLYLIRSNPKLPVEMKAKITLYMLMGSIAFLIHPIMDLESGVPLLYPLDLRGFALAFNMEIIQRFPPQLSKFQLEFITSPFNFSQTYDRQASALSTLDALFIFLILTVILSKVFVGLFEKLRPIFKETV
ncbi:MAG: hypothetical protein ACFFE8_06840 [Candidatus Heimdallarchaeota archaeon]